MKVERCFPLLYFAPTDYYRKIACNEHTCFVENERYSKQTLRNRCSIYGANGLIHLSIPVERPQGKNTLMNEARISYAENWRQIHWRSIKSAYGRAPYFEYFEYKIEPLFDKRYDLLVDFLMEANTLILDLLKIPKPHLYLEKMDSELQKALDLQCLPESYPTRRPYYQIFEDRHGFIPNLSVLDWIFHCGNKLD